MLRLDDPLNDISIFIVGGTCLPAFAGTGTLTRLPIAFAALRLYAIFGRDWRLLLPMLGIAFTRVGISIVRSKFTGWAAFSH